jgi:hypothetical protein
MSSSYSSVHYYFVLADSITKMSEGKFELPSTLKKSNYVETVHYLSSYSQEKRI